MAAAGAMEVVVAAAAAGMAGTSPVAPGMLVEAMMMFAAVEAARPAVTMTATGMEEVGEGTAEATEEAAVTTARVAATTTGDLTAAADILAAVHGATMTGRKEAAVVGAEREAALMTETGMVEAAAAAAGTTVADMTVADTTVVPPLLGTGACRAGAIDRIQRSGQ